MSSLVPTVGAELIGILVSTALYGLTTQQILVYFFSGSRKDGWKLKAYVFYIWALETVHLFLICSTLFRYVIIDFGNAEALLVTKVSDDVTTGITGLIILSVHMFYVRRLWILSDRNIYLCGVVVLLTTCHFGLVLAVMALTFKGPAFSEFHNTVTAYYTGSLATAAATDIIIAMAMLYLLSRRRSGIRSTNQLVSRIMTYCIMTGVLTSVIDIVILICFVTMPDNLVYLALFDFINNLYANSLLAMLNARESLGKLAPRGVHMVTARSTAVELTDFSNARHGVVIGSGNTAVDTQVSSEMVFASPKDVAASTFEQKDCEF